MDESRPRGRPSTYDRDVSDKILERMAAGESLKAICRDEDMPPASTVRGWKYDNVDGFSARYARARTLHVEATIEDLLEIADDGTNDWMKRNDPNNPGYMENGEAIRRSVLRADTRKWIASRILRQEYGDKPDPGDTDKTVTIVIKGGLTGAD